LSKADPLPKCNHSMQFLGILPSQHGGFQGFSANLATIKLTAYPSKLLHILLKWFVKKNGVGSKQVA
ncbi:MAG: hypothetical protein ABJN04_02910, partial [Hyphomicrobiales bacterium]